MDLKDSHGRLEADQLQCACQAAPGHLILKAQTGPAEAPLSPELLELIPRGPLSSTFLLAVSEHLLRLYCPLVELFSGVEIQMSFLMFPSKNSHLVYPPCYRLFNHQGERWGEGSWNFPYLTLLNENWVLGVSELTGRKGREKLVKLGEVVSEEWRTLVFQLHQDVKLESICPDIFIPYSAVNKINNVLTPGIIQSPSLVGILMDSVKKQLPLTSQLTRL